MIVRWKPSGITDGHPMGVLSTNFGRTEDGLFEIHSFSTTTFIPQLFAFNIRFARVDSAAKDPKVRRLLVESRYNERCRRGILTVYFLSGISRADKNEGPYCFNTTVCVGCRVVWSVNCCFPRGIYWQHLLGQDGNVDAVTPQNATPTHSLHDNQFDPPAESQLGQSYANSSTCCTMALSATSYATFLF